LDEAQALILVDEPRSDGRLHWGAPVRFELEDGMQRYEITGAIIARQEDSAPDPTADAAPTDPSTWELRVRVWECNLNVQRRTLPRRNLRMRVQLHSMPGEAPLSDAPDDAPPPPLLAWCVDIGAGGMRIRTARLKTVPARMRLEFSLPVSDGTHGIEPQHDFCLVARVIRSAPHGRHGDALEIAMCFEGLSVRDGMVLHNLLA
jgi:hypothetical protein